MGSFVYYKIVPNAPKSIEKVKYQYSISSGFIHVKQVTLYFNHQLFATVLEFQLVVRIQRTTAAYTVMVTLVECSCKALFVVINLFVVK